MVELMDTWIASGQIKVKKIMAGKTVTYHDPCNQARNGGIVAEPRRILQAIVDDFVEMQPHGIENFGCGGGGGLPAMSEYSPGRLAAVP